MVSSSHSVVEISRSLRPLGVSSNRSEFSTMKFFCWLAIWAMIFFRLSAAAFALFFFISSSSSSVSSVGSMSPAKPHRVLNFLMVQANSSL